MKKITLLLITLAIATTGFSQQISDGFAPIISDFNIPLKSGIYNSPAPTGITPDNSHAWQHLFVMRHITQSNNFQLQIASSFTTNDRLFFRKMASGDLSSQNPSWIELATRGDNTFTGNQFINGNVGIGTITPSSYEHGGNNKFLEVSNSNTTLHSQAHIVLSSGANIPNSSIGTITWALPNTTSNFKGAGFVAMRTEDSSTSSKPSVAMIFATRGAAGEFWSEQMQINGIGNVGIGTSNPKNKLDVNGTIHSKEVKVDMIGWSDFVFKKEYNLPTIAQVEKHINEKGHLPKLPEF